MYQSTAGTSLSRVAHAAARASKRRRLNTPEGRCVSAGGSTVPACGQIHSSRTRPQRGGKTGKVPKAERAGEGLRGSGMYQSTAGTSLSRVAHAAARASKRRRLNTPEGRCVSAGGSTVPACRQIHSSRTGPSKGRKARKNR